MKIVFSLLLVFVIPSTSFSYAQTQTSLDDGLYINVQSELRNSDGQLISFLESSKFTDINVRELYNFLDLEASVGNDPIVTIDGKIFQIIQRMSILTFDYETVIGSTNLLHNLDGQPIHLARFAHDGLPIVSGDTLQSTWTFVRLV